MKFNSKFFTYAFVIVLAIVILSCCFSVNTVEGAKGLGNLTRKCSTYGESGCPSGRCKVIQKSVNTGHGWTTTGICVDK